MANSKPPLLKRTSMAFLQGVIVLVGLAALAFMLTMPHFEGRNSSATTFEVYFKDPFLAYAYVGSIPLFVALFCGFKVLRYAGRNQIFSQAAVNAVRTAKFCAIVLIGFVILGEVFLLMNESDDRAGGVVMGVVLIFGSIVIATAAATVEQILQKAVDLKSESDLTV